MYQSITIIGNVGSKDSKFTPSGKSVCKASVATSSFKPGRDGAEGTTETEWWNIELWENQADRFNEKVNVGDLVFVTGRQKTEKWTDTAGVNQERKKVVADSWRLLKARHVNNDNATTEGDEEHIF